MVAFVNLQSVWRRAWAERLRLVDYGGKRGLAWLGLGIFCEGLVAVLLVSVKNVPVGGGGGVLKGATK